MKVEVDQSIRIEQLNQDTIIGIGTNRMEFACRLPAKIKRHYNERFRRIGKPRFCAPMVFAAAVIVAINKSNVSPTHIVIDEEYTGYENVIKSLIVSEFPHTEVSIERIGRKSPAHKAAYETHLKHRKADARISKAEIRSVLSSKIKRRLENRIARG